MTSPNISVEFETMKFRSCDDSNKHIPSFRSALQFWLKLGFINFGGPTGQIAIMHQELVDKKKWISEDEFLHALNYCMLLPGPEAQQLATYIGWLFHGIKGGLVAGVLFVLPSAFILWVLSVIYVLHGDLPWVEAVFYGLKPAVLAVIAAALLRIGKKVLKNRILWALAIAAFIAIFAFKAPFPLIILIAALMGILGGRISKESFLIKKSPSAEHLSVPANNNGFHSLPHCQPSLRRALAVFLVSIFLWFTPLFIFGRVLGFEHTIVREGFFFSKAALVTFGGAYAVLPYVSQQAVEVHQWLSPAQMLDGLGLAETTPGPLIMVLQFVGFLGGWNHPGSLDPLTAATLGACIATWTTFVPCFLWIFLGAPYIERLRGNEHLSAALSAITASVVGVILNLALWFAIRVLWPTAHGFDYFIACVSVAAFISLTRFQANIIAVIFACGAISCLYKTIVPPV